MTLTVDPEFKSIIPPLTPEEKEGLTNSLINEGCRDPLVVWGEVLIDGHNRYEICTERGIPFNTVGKVFPGRDDAIDWIRTNQLSRRNLTDESRTYLMGKLYEARKKREHDGGAGKIRSGDQNDPNLRTAEKIGKEQNVSSPTVKRAAEYAKAIDTLTENIGKEETDKILSGKTISTKKDIITLSNAAPEDQKKAFKMISFGEAKTIKDSRLKIMAAQLKDAPKLDGKYGVIYCDPPWEYSNSGFEMSAANQYPTMSIERMIDEIPVKEIADENCIMFMWATNPLLKDALELMAAWGFDYKTNMVWIKDRHTAGFYIFGQHEILLIGVKGSMLPYGEKPKSIIIGKNDVHSKKPESVYGIIEGLYPNTNYIELFARTERHGWKSWGNQL